jgi:hypothetical protein
MNWPHTKTLVTAGAWFIASAPLDAFGQRDQKPSPRG